MQITSEDLSRHYASLSDSELLEMDPAELTELAQQCYHREIEQRGLFEAADSEGGGLDVYAADEVLPDWIETAAKACSFQASGMYAENVDRACSILQDAGVPYEVVREREGCGPDLLSVMVPGALSLKASSILDRDLFNEELEETWRVHFDHLSDQELRAVHVEDLCAGLLDRAARLKRVYQEALAQRKSR